MAPESANRVVLGRKERGMVSFRWTGTEPSGMFETELAEELGARWEGDELVTYDLPGMRDLFEYHQSDDYLIDND
ncbi:MAG: hypothetical protein ACRDZ8_06965 [Acidimicrobiales bacterium]